jgi:hypothetical protein
MMKAYVGRYSTSSALHTVVVHISFVRVHEIVANKLKGDHSTFETHRGEMLTMG